MVTLTNQISSLKMEILDYKLMKHDLSEYVSKVDAAKIQEFVGKTIRNEPYGKVLVFLGNGSNGKTTVSRAIQNLVEKETKSQCNISHGYLKNLVSIPVKDLSDSDYMRIKTLVSGCLIHILDAEDLDLSTINFCDCILNCKRLNLRVDECIVPKCNLLISINKIPQGLSSSFEVIEFNHTF